jgi:hypothetical protein
VPACKSKMEMFHLALDASRRKTSTTARAKDHGGNESSSANGRDNGGSSSAEGIDGQIKRVFHGPIPGCPPDKDELGRGTWDLLHSIAATYPNSPSEVSSLYIYDSVLPSSSYIGSCQEHSILHILFYSIIFFVRFSLCLFHISCSLSHFIFRRSSARRLNSS